MKPLIIDGKLDIVEANCCGVYGWKFSNGRWLVGYSNSVVSRLTDYVEAGMLNEKARAALRDDGWNNVEAYLLEKFPTETDVKVLASAEARWADKLDAHRLGLNVAPCGANMGIANWDGESRLKTLLMVPTGMVVTSKWLSDRKISSALASYYCKSGWLTRLGRGAFVVFGGQPSVVGIASALGNEYHIGGVSALEYHGMSHFVPMSRHRKLWMWGGIHGDSPWVRKLEREVKFVRCHPMTSNLGITRVDEMGMSFFVSSPIRAMLEFLDDVEATSSGYEHAKNLMENLAFESVEDVEKHLLDCNSIKVRRLFLHLADTTNVGWFQKLRLDRIDIGSGNRVWFPRGRVASPYKITVPR